MSAFDVFQLRSHRLHGPLARAWVAVALSILFSGVPACTQKEGTKKSGSSAKGGDNLPTVDVRGGISDSEVYLGNRTFFDGNGGAGGSLRVSTSAGDIEIHDGLLTRVQRAQAFAGNGFDVAPGETRVVAGSVDVFWLRVQAGGTLRLAEDTYFRVLGDVLIAGKVDGRGRENSIDGKNLTINVLGDGSGVTTESVNITGVIDCSGFTRKEEDTGVNDRTSFAGGAGGEIFISPSSDGGVGVQVFVSGRINVDGGDTFSQGAASSLPGRGGDIFLGSLSEIAISGRLTARGGRAYFTFNGLEGDGGRMQLVAEGSVEMGGVRELNASGGHATGSAGGDGGSILLEAPLGLIDLASFDIECRGGRSLLLSSGTGGVGGTVTLSGASVAVDNVGIRVTGGDADSADAGIGGPGGRVTAACTTSLRFEENTFIDAEGGVSHAAAAGGGAGGSISMVNFDAADPTALFFGGDASVQGGRNAVNSHGVEGRICTSNASAFSIARLTGTNSFPIDACLDTDLSEVVVHDLDCDDGTIVPEEVTTSLPAIIGRDFYRVLVTQDMVTANAASKLSLTINTKGEDGRNLNLYASRDPADLGSSNPADYEFSSDGPTSDESIEITSIPGMVAGDYISILVQETSPFVEEYTIGVTCVLE